MAAGFERTSLAILLDCTPEEFVSDEHQRRVYAHERLHLWQTLSQGFIARQASLEWQRLQRFEQTGEVAAHPEFNDQLEKFFKKHSEWGFSAWNLSEALARFWDIQSTGASKILASQGKAQDVPIHDPGFDQDFRKLNQAGLPDLRRETSENFDYLMQLEIRTRGHTGWPCNDLDHCGQPPFFLFSRTFRCNHDPLSRSSRRQYRGCV